MMYLYWFFGYATHVSCYYERKLGEVPVFLFNVLVNFSKKKIS